MIPTTRQSFIEYILRRLGKGAVQVNLTPDQIDDRVDQALYLFYEQHSEATEELYIIHIVTLDEVDQKYIQLPDDIVGVSNVIRPNIQADIWSIEYQYFLNELYAMAGLYRYGDVSYYIMNKMHVDLLNRYFLPDRSWTYNKMSHKLVIAGGLKDVYNLEGALVFVAKRKILGELGDTDDPSNTSTYNIWQNRWLQNYTEALLKLQWATNLTKFQGIALPGNVVLKYEDMKTEAQASIDKLELQLKSEYQEPADFFMA